MSSILRILLLCCVWLQGSNGTGKNEFGLAVQLAQIAMNAPTFILQARLPLTWYVEFMAESEIAVTYNYFPERYTWSQLGSCTVDVEQGCFPI